MATLADLEAISKKTGISNTGSANLAASSMRTTATAPKAPSQNFFTNVAKSAVTIPVDVAKAVGNSIAQGFQHVAGGISEAVTAGAQNSANERYQQAIEDAGNRYHQLYASGKLSKAAYTKLSQGLIEQSRSLSNDINGQVSQMVTPGEFASGLATVGSLPFAGGRLTAQAGAGLLAKGARVLGATGKSQSFFKAAAKAPIKYPLVTQPVAQAPVDVAHDLKTGNVAGAAGTAALAAAPAIASIAKPVLSTAAAGLREAAFGRGSVLTDALGARVRDYVAKNPQKAPILQMMEQFTLGQKGVEGNSARAAEKLAEHLKSIGVDPKNDSLDQIVTQFTNYAKNVKKLELAKGGPNPTVQANAVISADFRDAIPKVLAEIERGSTNDVRANAKLANKALDEAGIKNETVRSKIVEAILNGADSSEIKDLAQKAIIPGVKLDKGFIATYGPHDAAPLPKLNMQGAPELGKAASPVLGSIAGGLKKAGIGLEDYNPQQINQARKAFASAVDDLNIPGVEGKNAYNQLSALADRAHVTDLRQLKTSEVAQGLDISTAEARSVLKATKNMYNDVPLSIRGAAGKLQDANLKINPLAAPYARIQSKLRYGINPVFRAQQRIEAATLSQVVTGGHTPVGDVSKTVRLMREDGFLPKAEGYAGEALRDTAGKTNITSYLTPSEENSLARVLQATADKNGRSITAELQDPKTRELLRMIVQNPKTGVLSSNFAKALNIAAFPTTYNVKVATLAAKALSSQPIPVQFGVLKSIADFNKYLQSDEGIKWKSNNAELIGLISYFTPINSIQQIYDAVSTRNPANLGLIGGLPFGVVQRVLQGQGIAPQTAPPYLDPKTGSIVPEQIPETDKARLQQAISDVLNTMFTYPGRQAGLGSKKDLLNTVTGNVLKPAQGETKALTRTGDLTAGQKNTQRVLAPTKQSTNVLPAIAPQRKLLLGRPQILPRPVTGGSGPRPKVYAKKPGTF